MELRVGDKVRWIGDPRWPIGRRGEVVARMGGAYGVQWDVGPTLFYERSHLLREFQPGDRVIHTDKKELAWDYEAGHPGVIVSISGTDDNEFCVAWKPTLGGRYHVYKYTESLYVAHAPHQSFTETARVISQPIIATSTPPPEPVRYGRCYFCDQDGESRENGFLMCDEHAERFKRK